MALEDLTHKRVPVNPPSKRGQLGSRNTKVYTYIYIPWKSKTIKENSPLELLIINPY